jgi:hypothetical protein
MNDVRLTIKLSERGLRVGQSHGRARLLDGEIEMMRRLREEGMSLTTLAHKFEVSRRYVCMVCTFRRRATTTTRCKIEIVNSATTG